MTRAMSQAAIDIALKIHPECRDWIPDNPHIQDDFVTGLPDLVVCTFSDGVGIKCVNKTLVLIPIDDVIDELNKRETVH